MVPPLRRYNGALRLPTPPTASFALCDRFRLTAPRSLSSGAAPLRPRARVLVSGSPAAFSRRRRRISQVPGKPLCPRAPLLDPGGPPGPRQIGSGRCCLPLRPWRRPPRSVHFGARLRGPLARCLRFAAWVTPGPRKTRYRPAGWALAGRDFHPLGFHLEFQKVGCLLSLRARHSPGARTSNSSDVGRLQSTTRNPTNPKIPRARERAPELLRCERETGNWSRERGGSAWESNQPIGPVKADPSVLKTEPSTSPGRASRYA